MSISAISTRQLAARLSFCIAVGAVLVEKLTRGTIKVIAPD